MELDAAMELSFWKEEPLSPLFSGLEEAQNDVWQIFTDDVVKQAQSPPQESVGDLGGWLPDSPSDSCDSIDELKAKGQLASQLLEDLDFCIKDEPSFQDWYETKTDLPIFEELPSPTASQDASSARPFAALTLTSPFVGLAVPTFAAPAPPAAVPVPASAVQPLQPLLLPAHSLQQLRHPAAADAAPAAGLLTIAQPQQLLHQPTDTQTLLQEFESVFGAVEQSHSGTLTPPQSPPHEDAQAQAALYSLPGHLSQPHQSLLSLAPLAQDEFRGFTPQQQQLIAEVDELVSARAPRADDWHTPSPAFAPPSPCTSSTGSSSSGFSSPGSPSPASPASPASPVSSTDDPDWAPSPAEDAPGPVKGTSKASRAAGSAGRKKRASKPYSNTVEDKRMRKKEQNKNAATRYRMKKKAEVEEILGEENELKAKNDELAAKVQDLSQEIRYLKGLMRELFRSKGLIK